MTSPQETGWKRAAEMATIFMTGDGMLGLFQPERHVALWRSRWRGVDTLVRPFSDHSRGRRVYGLVQVAAGLALASMLRSSSAKQMTKPAEDGD